MALKLLRLRKLCNAVRPPPSPLYRCRPSKALLLEASVPIDISGELQRSHSLTYVKNFCSRPLNPEEIGPAPMDYRSLLQEDEFHRLADFTIHDLQEKFEEYGESIHIDGFDIDYGNEVLTVKLGDLGTYVLNKQTPNRQIWLSSPVSGPSRFDWDQNAHSWIYRRTKASLREVLQTELEKLCGEPINLS